MNEIICRSRTVFLPVLGIVLGLGLTLSPVTYGAESGKANLVFHMALSNQQTAEVHATVENAGGIPIDRGYIVVSGRNALCQSNGDVLQSFSHIPVGGKIPVKIKLPSGSSGYLVTAFQAFDDFSFPISTHDNTAKIIKEREADERRECEKNRGAASTK
ncbi:hypothetical protein [Aeromonas jandaei]|uniref:hypothetical protein n=1 Tax=Aeromonas jandaei TaxID=650 RepID=UPI003EC6BE60